MAKEKYAVISSILKKKITQFCYSHPQLPSFSVPLCLKSPQKSSYMCCLQVSSFVHSLKPILIRLSPPHHHKADLVKVANGLLIAKSNGQFSQLTIPSSLILLMLLPAFQVLLVFLLPRYLLILNLICWS